MSGRISNQTVRSAAGTQLARAAVALALATALGTVSTVELALPAAPPDFESACDAREPYYVASCYLGQATTKSNRDYDIEAPSVVLFSDTPDSDPHFSLSTFKHVGAV